MARLTIPDEATSITYTVTTSQSVFNVPFSLVDGKADLVIAVGGTTLSQTDFEFSGTLLEGGGYDGGTVTLDVAVENTTVTIRREVAIVRTTNFAPSATVPVRTVDMALNRVTAVQQDLATKFEPLLGLVLDPTLVQEAIDAGANLAAYVEAAENANANANTRAAKAANLSDLADAAAARTNIGAAGSAALAASTGAALVSAINSGTGAVSRTIQAKLREIVSVADFGAMGNGTNDDTPAIQAAIDSLGAAGGTVLIPRNYRCLIDTALTVKKIVTLLGPHKMIGSPGNNSSAPYGSIGGCLIVNSAVTITMQSGSTVQGITVCACTTSIWIARTASMSRPATTTHISATFTRGRLRP